MQKNKFTIDVVMEGEPCEMSIQDMALWLERNIYKTCAFADSENSELKVECRKYERIEN